MSRKRSWNGQGVHKTAAQKKATKVKRTWASEVKITSADGSVRYEPALPGTQRTNTTRVHTGHRFGAISRKRGRGRRS